MASLCQFVTYTVLLGDLRRHLTVRKGRERKRKTGFILGYTRREEHSGFPSSGFLCSLPELEVDNKNPTEINSFHVNKALNMDIVELSKKRKLQAEQLGLPIPKHKCWSRSLLSNTLSMLDRSHEVVDFHLHVIKRKPEDGATDDGSETESGKDSNSFVGDSDHAIPLYAEYSGYEAEDASARKEAEKAKIWSFDRPSSSSFSWDSYSFKKSPDSLDITAVTKGVTDKTKLISAGGEHSDDTSEVAENSKKSLIECRSHVDYLCSEYGIDSIEQFTEKEIEDNLYSNDVNPNNFVLSSGRWSVNQGTEQSTKKPTIDQEFEQYFSMLML